MLRCSLYYLKIMQIEGRTSNLFECYAEMQLILSKDNAKIMQEYKYTSLFNKKLHVSDLSCIIHRIMYIIGNCSSF